MSSIDQLIFGTAGLSSLPSQGRAMRLLELAYAGGIRHFDTAPLYGQGYAEWVLGRFLSKKGKQISLTGKFGMAGGVSPRLDPRLAMPLNYFRKKVLTPGPLPTPVSGEPDRAQIPFRRITRVQVETSFLGSLKRLGCTRFEYFMIHEGLPSFLDDDARTWLLRQQAGGCIGSLGVATRGHTLLGLSAADLEGFDILQYEAGSIFEVLKSQHPDKRHFLHSCFSSYSMKEASLEPSGVLKHWAGRNPDGKIIFFTRRPAVLSENMAPFHIN
jgi:aryl-alcohol dehydrogenase-like predicted oxidoreductase